MPEDKNILDHIFDVVRIPERASSSVAAGLFLDEDPAEWWGEKKDYQDFVREAYPDMSNEIQSIVGLAMAIGFDPTTYAGFGIPFKGGKGAKALVTMGGRKVIKGEGTLEAIAARKADIYGHPAGQWMGKIFGGPDWLRRYRYPQLAEPFEKFQAERASGVLAGLQLQDDLAAEITKRGLSEGETAKIINYLETIKRGTGREFEFAKRQVKMLEGKDASEIYEMAGAIKRRHEERWAKIYPGFLKIEEKMQKRNMVAAHMPHFVADYKKASKGIGKEKRLARIDTKMAGAPVHDLYPETFMKRGRPGTLAQKAEKYGEGAYETHLPVILGKSAVELAHAESSYKYLKGILKEVGSTEKLDGYTQLTGPSGLAKLLTDEAGKKVYIPSELKSEVLQLSKAVIGMDDVTHGLLGAFDAGTNWFRRTTLFMFPNYHVRNFFGDIWLNHIAGGVHYNDYIKGGKFMWQIRHNKMDAENRQLYEWMLSHRILEGAEVGEVARRIPASYKEAALQGWWAPWKILSENHALTQMGVVTSMIQSNTMRASHFISRIRQGWTPENAAMSVKKHLFQYGREGLSTTEYEIFRRAIPFYTWLRKNLPRQMSALIERPGRFASLSKMIDATESLYGPQPIEKWMSEYMKKSAPLFMGEGDKPGTYKYFLLKSWVPAADLLMLEDPVNEIAAMMNPFPKEILQQFFNWDVFFEDKVTRMPHDLHPLGGEQSNFLGMTLNKRLIHLMKNVRLLNELDKANPGNVFGADRPHHIDPDGWTRAINVMVGKFRPYDPQVARTFWERDFRERVSVLKGLVTRSLRRGYFTEADRYRKELYKEIVEHFQP